MKIYPCWSGGEILLITALVLISCGQSDNSELSSLHAPDTVIIKIGDAHDTTRTKPLYYFVSIYDQRRKEVFLSHPGTYNVSVGIENYDVKLIPISGSDNVTIRKVDSVFYKIDVDKFPDSINKMDAVIYFLPDTSYNILLLHVKWRARGDSVKSSDRILNMDTVNTVIYKVKK